MSQPEIQTPPATAPAPPIPSWEEGGAPPLFGSWRAIHAAVIVCAVAVMVLAALFSRWPF
jgi:hypothetical protein